MNFAALDELDAVRAAARQWVADWLDPAWLAAQRSTGSNHSSGLHRLLAHQGWLGAGWPREEGGSDQDPALAKAIFQEINAAGVHMDGWTTTAMVCRTIQHVGTKAQRREIISAALRGEIVIALGYTEPSCGSDVAAVKTRAVRADGGWIVNGQKMFTSTAELATHVFLLARTSPDLPKHDGLTMFLVPLGAPGVTCEPIFTLGGVRTNSTFYVDVPIEDSDRIGDIDGGWSVMRIALVYERNSSFARPTGPASDELVAEWARTVTTDDGGLLFDDPVVRERLARIAVDNEVTKLLGMRSTWASMQGNLSGVEGSSHKLWKTEAARRHNEDLMDIVGHEAVLNSGAPDAPLSGDIEASFRMGVVETIRGGTSEILRSVIAERGLGLPRVRFPEAAERVSPAIDRNRALEVE